MSNGKNFKSFIEFIREWDFDVQRYTKRDIK